MITVEQIVPGTLTLSFKYYRPYIDRVKSLGARFEPTTKTWELDEHNIDNLEEEFQGELFFKTPKWEIVGEPAPDYSEMYKFDIDTDISKLGFKLKPFPYQEFGIKFLVDRVRSEGMGFTCDDVGLGKTIQAIGTIKNILDNDLAKDVIIVCKKSLKSQWKEEIEKFVDIDANIYIAEDLKNKRYKTYDKVKADPHKTILILNYHVLLNDSKLLKPGMVVYDEVHVAKKHDGKINKACKEITQKSKYCLFMTGTPIMSKPDDLFGIVSIKDKKYFGGSYKKFEDRYLVKSYDRYAQVVGYRNLDELREKTQRIILRRTANEVAIDLPEVVTIDKLVEMDELQLEASEFIREKVCDAEDKIEEIKKRITKGSCIKGLTDKEKEKLDELKRKRENLECAMKGFIAIEQIVANNPRLIHFSKSKAIQQTYKQFTPNAKYVSKKYIKLLDIVEEMKEAGQKVIIFSKYETVVRHICDFLDSQKIKAVPYYGQLNEDERDKAVNEFKFNDTVTAIVGTDAMAEGLNLQIANAVIHVDLPYNQAIYQQRVGRARRAGSNHSTVISYNLITAGTIDEAIHKKIKETKRDFDVFVSANKAQSKVLKELSN